MNYIQTEGISYTDNEWVFYPQIFVNTCIYIPLVIYQYVIGREGQTVDPKILSKNANHNDKLVRSMINFSNTLADTDKNKFSYQRMESQIAYLSMLVYRSCLILQDKVWDKILLEKFDRYLYNERKELYVQLGKLRYRKYLPVRYVKFWRLIGKRFSLDWIYKIYRKLPK